MSEIEQDCRRLREEGYVVVPGVLDDAPMEAIRAELAPHLTGRHGRNDFEGRTTERIYAALAKSPAIAPLVEHPRLLGVCDAFLAPSYLLASVQAVNIHPGEKAQDLHCDDDFGAPPRPRAPQGVSCMWALDAFTGDNGSTRLVPGSHRWGPDRIPQASDAISVEMPAGSLLIWLGGVFHGGGAHRAGGPRLGISVIFYQPWLRQFENLTLAVPPKVAAHFSTRVQRLLGYGMSGPLGSVDGRDPIRLVEAESGD